RRQFETAANLALAIELEVLVDAPGRRRQGPGPGQGQAQAQAADPTGFAQPQQTFLVAVPGQTFTLTARLHNRGRATVTNPAIQLDVPPEWRVVELKGDGRGSGENDDSGAQAKEASKILQPGDNAEVRFRVTVPPN